jgi:hypothetical protein
VRNHFDTLFQFSFAEKLDKALQSLSPTSESGYIGICAVSGEWSLHFVAVGLSAKFEPAILNVFEKFFVRDAPVAAYLQSCCLKRFVPGAESVKGGVGGESSVFVIFYAADAIFLQFFSDSFEVLNQFLIRYKSAAEMNHKFLHCPSRRPLYLRPRFQRRVNSPANPRDKSRGFIHHAIAAWGFLLTAGMNPAALEFFSLHTSAFILHTFFCPPIYCSGYTHF